jgi:hypothetical protein
MPHGLLARRGLLPVAIGASDGIFASFKANYMWFWVAQSEPDFKIFFFWAFNLWSLYNGSQVCLKPGCLLWNVAIRGDEGREGGRNRNNGMECHVPLYYRMRRGIYRILQASSGGQSW